MFLGLSSRRKAMGFARVNQILVDGIVTWQNAPDNDNPADFSGHGASFGYSPEIDPTTNEPKGWKDKATLLAAVGHGKQLIQPEVIGNGMGNQANLIIDLRTGFPGAGRMPLGGPFIADPQIQEIVDWINAGCPD
jgi:hypothetical protein